MLHPSSIKSRLPKPVFRLRRHFSGRRSKAPQKPRSSDTTFTKVPPHSPDGLMLERCETVLDCEPLLGSVTPVHQRGETTGGEGRLVAASACRWDRSDDGRSCRTPGCLIQCVRKRLPLGIIRQQADRHHGRTEAMRHFETNLTCSTNLWGSEQIIGEG